MGCVASALDEEPETGELRRLADTLVRLGCQRATVNRALKVFGKADKDGSGSINIAEFAAMFHLRSSNTFLPRLLSLFDVTGDGDIGALEFVICLAQFFTSDQHAHIYFAWRLFDQDDSGSMTAEEFREILFNTMNYLGKGGNADKMEDRQVVLGRAGARVKVKGFATLIAEADVDHNGVITIDEFKVLAAHSPHLVAPAFELWSALEMYSKPCYALKQEIMAVDKWKQVTAMINPKAAASMKLRNGEETKVRRPQRPSDHRETKSAPQGGARRERRRAPRAEEPGPSMDEMSDVVGARGSRQLGGNAEHASKEERTHRRSHHARDGRDEREHRSHHHKHHKHHRDDRARRHRNYDDQHRHDENARRTQEVSPSQYYEGAGGGRGDAYGAPAHRQHQQSYDQGMPPMDSHYGQRAPHTQQQRYGQGSPQMYQQQYGHGAPQSPAYNGGYDNGGYGGQPQQPHGHSNMHSRGYPTRGAPPRRTNDDDILNQLERDLGF